MTGFDGVAVERNFDFFTELATSKEYRRVTLLLRHRSGTGAESDGFWYEFHLHDLVLAAHSDFLKQVLRENPDSTDSNPDYFDSEGEKILILDGYEPRLLKILILFIYSGKIICRLSDRDALRKLAEDLDLLILSQLLQVEDSLWAPVENEVNEVEKKAQINSLNSNNLYLCPYEYCPEEFNLGRGLRNQKMLDLHIQVHEDGGVNRCINCGEEFENFQIYYTHYRRAHHIRNYGQKTKCEECGRFVRLIHQHREIHKLKKERKTLVCTYCGKKFISVDGYRVHVRIHTGQTFDCEICGKKFRNRAHHRMHQNEHNGVKPYICDFCGLAFYDYSRLSSHRIRIHFSKRFSCKYCERAFPYKNALQKHISKIHLRIRDHICEICDSTFLSGQNRLNHIRLVHMKNKSAPASEVKEYVDNFKDVLKQTKVLKVGEETMAEEGEEDASNNENNEDNSN